MSLIDPQLYKQMNKTFKKSKKALDTLLKQKLDQANDQFHPICLRKLQPEDFVTVLTQNHKNYKCLPGMLALTEYRALVCLEGLISFQS